jgi:hypothetical protein
MASTNEPMIARCLFTSLSAISDAWLQDHVREHVHQMDIGLTPGEAYRVYGVIFRSDIAWFFLCDEAEAEYPKPYCSAFFELIDAGVPKNWKLVPQRPALLVPAEWTQIPHFLEKLVDGDPAAAAVFARLRHDFPPT